MSDSIEDMLCELRRRALHVVKDEDVDVDVEPMTLADEADIARVNELIEQNGWHHLRIDKK